MKQLIAQVSELQQKVDELGKASQRQGETVQAIFKMTARSPTGRTLIQLAESIAAKLEA